MKLAHKTARVTSPYGTLADSFDFADNLVLNKLFSVSIRSLVYNF